MPRPVHNPPRPRAAGCLRIISAVRGWCCGLLFLGLLALPAQAQVSKEYQLKAAFLYNFAKFVEWPAARFESPAAPLVIGVFGKSPFGEELQNIVRNRKINGRDIVIKQVETVTEARGAHLLFFSAAEDARTRTILGELQGAGVLTVGETEQFSQLGGMIHFLLEGDKVRFDINMDSTGQTGLKISAQLQKLAKTVRRKK